MADIRVRVTDSTGSDLAGAKIHLRLRNHAFRWGSTVNVRLIGQLNNQGFGFDSDHPYFVHLKNFNSITPDNAGKWKFWDSPERPKYLETMDWLNENGIANRGHTTIWASITRWNAVPAEVVGAGPVIENGVVMKTKAEVVRDLVREHIEEQLPILQDKKVYELDLINELINEGEIVKLLMELPPEDRPEEHAQWHKWAKAAAPEIDLVVNEYDLFQSGNNFYQRYIEYVTEMIQEGAPVDVVGMQGHFFGQMPPYEELKRRLAQVSVLGIPMSVTEFDMRETGYSEMQRVLYAVFSEPLVQGFSMWGAWDGSQWRNNGPMFREDWSLKESGRAWLDLVKGKWWTDTLGTSQSGIPFMARGFLGEYDLFVEHEGRTYHRQFDLGKEGTDLTVSLADQSVALPEIRILTPDDRTTAFIFEPLELTLSNPDSIQSVRYFQNDLLQASRGESPFPYLFSSDKAGTFEMRAEVELKNGIRLVTPVVAIQVRDDNEFPLIEEVFPPSGASVLQSDALDVFVKATDPEGDPLNLTIHTITGIFLGSTDSDPFHLTIDLPQTGFQHLILRVQDSKFGFQEINYFLNVLSNLERQTTALIPLAGADDVEESIADGTISLTGDLDLGEKIVGIRFPISGIPPKANIDSAFLQFTSEKARQEGETLILWQAENRADPAPFSQTNSDLSQRSTFPEQIPWTPSNWDTVGDAGLAQRSPDLSPLIQELVSLPEWTDQSPIHLIGQVESAPSKRSAYSFDQLPDAAPQLIVNYSPEGRFSPPANPSGFTFTRTGEDRGVVSWDFPEPASVQGYKFFLDGRLVPLLLRQPEYELSGLVEDSVYTVEVQSINELSILSDKSQPFLFQLSGEVVSTIEAFPNPVGDHLQLRNAVRVQLYDTQGRLILERTGPDTQIIDTSSLPSGIYFLRLWGRDSRMILRQLIKP